MDTEATLKSLQEHLAQQPLKDQDAPTEGLATPAVPAAHLQPGIKQIESLIALANEGDAEAGQAVRKFFADDNNPMWRQLGDLADVARRALASALFGQKPVQALSVERHMRHKLASLVDKDNSPLERMMIERVVIAWGFAHAVDLIAATAGEAILSPAVTKAQETAEKRCHAALKSLQLAREISRGAVGKTLRLVMPGQPEYEQRSKERGAG